MRSRPDILCIGSVHWDLVGRSPVRMRKGADLPGRIERRPGGVALNIAMALARLGFRPALLSAVGGDAEGEALVAACEGLGLVTEHLHRPEGLPTDRYMAVEAADGLIAAVADARTLETSGARVLEPLANGRLGTQQAPWPGPVVIDGNLTATLLTEMAASPLLAAAELHLVSASPGKAERLRPLLGHPRTTLYVNLAEAESLIGARTRGARSAAEALLAMGVSRALVTDGPRSAARAGPDGVTVLTPPKVTVERVTGAGDAFIAAHIAAERLGETGGAALASAIRAAARHVAGEAP